MPSFWAAAFPKTLWFESSIKGSTWGGGSPIRDQNQFSSETVLGVDTNAL